MDVVLAGTRPLEGAAMGKRGKRSAYFVFSEIERKRTKDELVAGGAEKVSVADVAKALGEKWRNKSDEEKRKYAEMAEKEAAEAAEKMDVDGEEDEGNNQEEKEKSALTIPLSMVRKIILLDRDVKKVSKEAVETIAISTEAFLEFLALESGKIAASLSRKAIRFEDVHAAARKFPPLEFVDEHLSLVDGEAKKLHKREKETPHENPPSKSVVSETPSTRRITDFFNF